MIFSGAASFLYIAYAVYEFTTMGASLFTVSCLPTFFNLLITICIYLIIFTTNIRNDNYAYVGILMFVFYMAFDQVFSLVQLTVADLSTAAGNPGGFSALMALTWTFLAGEAGTGVALYILISRYERLKTNNFLPLRVLSIVYSAFLATALIFYLLLEFYFNMWDPSSGWVMFLMLAAPVSEVLLSVAVIFTLERLRRY